MRMLLFIFGLLMVAMGMLFIMQALGYVQWPSSSFMIGERQWSDYGALIGAGGLVLLWISLRMNRQ